MGEQRHWDWRRRSLAEVIWTSFLAAAVGTMVFFALVDPLGLQDALTVPLSVSAMSIYSFGFFFFWGISLLSASLTTWLIRTERRRSDFPDPEPDEMMDSDDGPDDGPAGRG